MIKPILVAMSLICSMAYGQDIERPPVEWKLIYGLTIEGGKAYIDQKSHMTTTLNNGTFKSADIMISYDKPINVVSGKTLYLVGSKVRTVVIECDSGMSAPVYDLLFKEQRPIRSSKPLTVLEYPVDVKSIWRIASIVEKKTPLYDSLCPSYI